MSSELGLSGPTIPRPRLDGVGIFWITGCSIWTVLLSCGMTFLWRKRHLPFLRIRHLAVTFSATILLHLYWITIEIGYTLADLQPEEVEFWLMSILYPAGLGLFFYGNAELLHVAKLQKKYAEWNSSSDTELLHRTSRNETPPKNKLHKAWREIQELEFAFKALIFVGVGMLLQVFLTVLMFLISRKYHSTWGISGTQVTGSWWQRHIGQGRGWEWWPTIAWQLFWGWIVAPIILWRTRRINDTHGWRIQTAVCCIATIPAVPMWLIALYVPGMAPCNKYWIPVQWIGISIWFIEAFTVWVPCWQVLRHHSLQQDTLDAIALWESRTMKRDNDNDRSSQSPSPVPHAVADTYKAMEKMEAGQGREGVEASSAESIYTMDALEHTLTQNPEPLRLFSALRDFSGENIVFLISVRQWKNMWPTFSTPRSSGRHDGPSRRELYKRAVHIYANCISPQYADFPVNLGWQELRSLDYFFQEAARILYGDSRKTSISDVSPFSEKSGRTSDTIAVSGHEQFSERPGATESDVNLVDLITQKVQYWGDIPDGFNRNVFDEAEKSIKYLVLTNTWPKFVRDKDRRDEVTPGTSDSNRSRVSTYFKGIKGFPFKSNL